MKTLISKSLDFARRHIILALSAKFFAGLVIGFGLGVYFLPILIADSPVDDTIVLAQSQSAERQASFSRDRADSDAFHWGEGTLYLSSTRVTLDGELSPGPDYRLYLTPKFVETEDAFESIKSQSLQVASIKGFKNFSYEIPPSVDINQYDAVVIWCERFGEFITSGTLTPRDG